MVKNPTAEQKGNIIFMCFMKEELRKNWVVETPRMGNVTQKNPHFNWKSESKPELKADK